MKKFRKIIITILYLLVYVNLYSQMTSNLILLSACDAGDKKIVIKSIKDGADINAQNEFGVTPLMIASEKGYFEIVKLLVDSGAQINVQSPCTKTSPFLSAVKFNHYEIIEYLAQKGASLDLTDCAGYSAIMYASAYGFYKTAEFLIKNKANINCTNSDGSALFFAVYWNDFEMINLLINNNADTEIGDNRDFTPLMLAVQNKNYNIIDFLLSKGANINKISKIGMTPLLLAIQENDLKLVKYLIQKGADVNLNTTNLNPLSFAEHYNYLDIINYLKFLKAKRKHKLRIENISLALFQKTNLKIYSLGSEINIHESKFNIQFLIGASLFCTDVEYKLQPYDFVKKLSHKYYYLGFSKPINIIKNSENQGGITFGFKTNFFSFIYHNEITKNYKQFTPSFSLGVFKTWNNFSINFGYEFLNTFNKYISNDFIYLNLNFALKSGVYKNHKKQLLFSTEKCCKPIQNSISNESDL